MQLLTTLMGVALLVAAVGLRAYPCLKGFGRAGSDRTFHFAFIDMLRRNGHRPGAHDPRFLLRGAQTYPALYHWLLSFLPSRIVSEHVDRWSGFVFDAVAGVLICVELTAGTAIGREYFPSLLALYILAPALTLIHVGPRAFSLTPRSFSQVLAGALIATLLSDNLEAPARPVLILILIAALISSSKFALQVLVFSVLPFSALTRSFGPIAYLFAGALLAILGSRGYVFGQIRNQIHHLQWYARRNVQFMRARGNWRALGRAIKARDPLAFAAEIFVRNPVIAGMVRHAPLFVALVILASTAQRTSAQIAAASIAIATIPAWFFTSWGKLRIFGEAERYLEFAFPATWFLLWSVLPRDWRVPALAVAATFHFVLFLLNIKALRRYSSLFDESARVDIAQAIEQQETPAVLPIDDAEVYELYLRTSAFIFGLQHPLSPGPLGWPFVDHLYDPYPQMRADVIIEACRSGAVNYVLCHKDTTARAREVSVMLAPGNLERVYANERYELLRVVLPSDIVARSAKSGS